MVNTFLPYPDFQKCAKVLDNKRLGKQRVEAMQIINVITKKMTAWSNHPAVNMWRGYINALKLYYNHILAEWINRGYKNNMPVLPIHGKINLPWFIGNKSFHLSHQANLIRKDHNYAKIFRNIPNDYVEHTYIWPTKLTDEQKNKLNKLKNEIVNIKEFSNKNI